MSEFLTTKELAELLRIKERKIYDLAASGTVPCSKATGKLLFPRDAINAWLKRHGSGLEPSEVKPRPDVFLGSHDPLLDWALRESHSGIATYFDGSADGLSRFGQREGLAAGLHLYEASVDDWNTPLVIERCGALPVVLIEWAKRQRGFASLYDGASAFAEGILMADRLQRKRHRVVISKGDPPPLSTYPRHLHSEPRSRGRRDRLGRVGCDGRRGAGGSGGRRDDLRRRAVTELLRRRRGLAHGGRGGARRRRAGGRCRQRSAQHGAPRESWRRGLRHRGRRGPVARPVGELRRSLSRLPGGAGQSEASRARTPGGRDRRCRRSTRFRAHAGDSRAAHSSREGDFEHLHESVAVCPGDNDLPGAPRQERPAPTGRDQPPEGGGAQIPARSARRRLGLLRCALLQRVPALDRPLCGRSGGAARRAGHPRGVPLAEEYPELGETLLVAVTETNTPEEIELYATELAAVLEADA